MKTETEFPADTGTTITVSCQEGYINTGSSVVTCNTYLYQEYEYNIEPDCSTRGKFCSLIPTKSQAKSNYKTAAKNQTPLFVISL